MIFNLENKNKSNRGYIALISVIVISLVLVSLTSLLSYGGYFTRASAANGEYKRISLGLAESCVNKALLEIAKNPDYLGNEPSVNVGAVDTCGIKTVIYYNPSTSSECSNPTSGYDSNNQKVACITTQANYKGAFSNMTITAKVQDPNVVFVIPTVLVVSVNVDQLLPGDSLSDFHLTLNGEPVISGYSNPVPPGIPYTAAVASTPSGYSTLGWYCNGAAGATIIPVAGSSNSCSIYYTQESTTANLTVVANIFPTGPTSNLKITNNSTGDVVQEGTSPKIVAQVPAGVSYTVSATTPDGYQASKWSGACNPDTGVTSSLIAGTYYTCVINFTQPAPTCADTVMMLDRTVSMFGNSQWIQDEKTAAKALLDLYNPLSPHPQVGVGRFADNTRVNADIVAHLTTDYTGLYTSY